MARSKNGFVLLASALMMLALAGVAGLSIDVGHLYAVRAEAQSLADSLALTAAREIDGTRAGMERAKQRMAAVPVTGYLRVAPPSRIVTDYSADGSKWEASPSRIADVRRVRVRVDLDAVELFFLPAVIPNRTASVRTLSIAQQDGSGLSSPVDTLPYAVYARTQEGPAFGFRDADRVTLRWSSEGAGCGSPLPPGAGPGDGYVQGVARDRIREAIEDGLLGTPVEQGRPVRMVHADPYQQAASLVARAKQDTNRSARTFADYRKSPGNGRRTAQVAVIDASRTVLGFVQVFLPVTQPPDESEPLCAEFAGSSANPVVRYARLVR